MTEPNGLLAILFAFLIVTVSPGPANIAVATVAMRSGRRAGLLFGMGLAVGLAFWGLIAATGMGALLQTSEHALIALKLGGGAYLVWLAWQSGRAAVSPAIGAVETGVERRWFVRGLILNLSNPKAVVAWMAALSMGLGVGEAGAPVLAATLICMVIGVMNYAGHAVAFSLPGFMAAYARLSRWIDGVVAGLFALAGFSLIRSALSR